MADIPSNSELTDDEKRACVCRCAFDGDEAKLAMAYAESGQ